MSVFDLANQAWGSKIIGNISRVDCLAAKNLRCTIWNYRHLKMVGSSLPGKCIYTYGLHLPAADFYNKNASFANNNNDFLMFDLIKGDLLSASKVYYGKFADYDSLDWRDLLLRREIKAWGLHERPDRLSLDYIFTTCLPQEDAGRYYSA